MSWYRSLTPDGKLWAETSDPDDNYLVHTDPDTPMTFEKLVTRTVQEWVPWEPGELGPHPSTTETRFRHVPVTLGDNNAQPA